MRPDEMIAATAGRQHGLVTARQAAAAGLGRGAVRSRVRAGRWRVVHRGVYAIAGAPPSWHQVVLAACLGTDPPVAASHHTAARLWGLRAPEPDAVDLLTTRERRVRLAGVRHHTSLRMPVADLAWRTGVPVTTPARTLVDLAGDLGPELGRAIDAALRGGVLTLADLVRCVGRFDGAHGRPLAGVRAAVVERLGREPGGSDGELWVLRTLLAAGLPVPAQEHPVVLEGRRRRIDLAYPEQMVAIEFEGEAVHDTVSAFHDDKARASALAAAGWAVLPFTAKTSEADIVRRTRAALDLAALRRPA